MGKGKRRSSADDAQIFRDIDELRNAPGPEYGALAELAGVDQNHGLGRLPLALVQAGSFIRSYTMSF